MLLAVVCLIEARKNHGGLVLLLDHVPPVVVLYRSVKREKDKPVELVSFPCHFLTSVVRYVHAAMEQGPFPFESTVMR